MAQWPGKIGFVGLGNMGGPMAINLARAGFDLTVFDAREEALLELEEQGARRAHSIAELARSVNLLCVCVFSDDQLRQVCLGEAGIIAAGQPGLRLAVHSTVLPSTVVQIGQSARAGGIGVIDAPVSGANDGARAGALTVMVGADHEDFDAVHAVLQAVASNVFHVGPVGAGQAVKLANNLMGLINVLVASEAARLANAYGVQTPDLFRVASVSSGASRAIERWEVHDRIGVEHTLAGLGELPYLLAKDLRYAVSAATERQTELPIAALCSQLLPQMYAERWNRAAEH
jgi:3-hydroxyisobutyrate dehydrogenase-like beta-hydroxyacid dehydrogenase